MVTFRNFITKLSPGLIVFCVLALGIIAVPLWYIGFFLSNGLCGGVGREEISRVVSPGGSIDAVVIQTNGGATTSFGHLIYVIPHGQKMLPDKKKNDKFIVAFVESTEPRLQWESPNQLVVVHINDKYSDLRQSQITVAGQNVLVALREGPTDPPPPKPSSTAETTSTARLLK